MTDEEPDGIGAEESAADAETARPMIASIQDLMAILSPITAAGREIWYRGHRDQSWLLRASAFRTPSHRENEKPMLSRFRQEAAATGLQYSFDDWGWITFAQHHGLPTRLLDWSQSPLVALFFACTPPPSRESDVVEADGEFFLLFPHQLNNEAGDSDAGQPQLLTDNDTELTKYLPGKDADSRSKPRSVLAPLLFDRIRFQAGTFTVEQSPRPQDEEQPLRNAQALQSFVVPSSAKDGLRNQLDALGFNDASIYRDLDRIARRISRGV